MATGAFDVTGVTGVIKITQEPGEAAKFTTTLAGWDANTSSTTDSNAHDAPLLRIDAYEYGVDIVTDSDRCLAPLDRGEIFHPLKEEKLGVDNPYADPERGLIKDIAYDSAATMYD